MAQDKVDANLAFIAGSDFDAVWFAPLGTALPTDLEDLPAIWEHGGWIHADGLTEAPLGSKTEIRGHQGQAVVRSRIETPGTQYSVTLLEDKPLTRKLRYVEKSSAVTTGVRRTVRGSGQKVTSMACVIEVADADQVSRVQRHCFSQVDITPNGERVFSGTDIAGFPFLLDVIGDYEVLEAEPIVTP